MPVPTAFGPMVAVRFPITVLPRTRNGLKEATTALVERLDWALSDAMPTERVLP